MLKTILKRITNQRLNTAVKQQNSPAAHSIWEDTGQVYYLENTLKLTYQSNAGAVTLEKLSLDALPTLLAEIESLNADSPMAQKTTAQQTEPFNISVSAITWQKNGDTLRVKAIPEAALLRSKTGCFSKSQAIFRHSVLLEHDDLMTPTTANARDGAYIYNRISVLQFARQITDANARLTQKYRRLISINQDNFDAPFTQHESEQIENVLGFDMVEKITKR